MHNYLFPIEMAFFFFPFLAFLITIPYALYQYRKYGSIPVLRTIIVYSFVLYLLTIYFLVILPLPPITKVEHLTTPAVQLMPFQFVFDFLKESGFVWNDLSTYINAFKDPSCYNVLFNIVMFIPLGIYLRYYFKMSFLKTIFISFLLSLFFEITQLSGLYGIYPRPYRLFDVDDLFVNILGGTVGYFLTSLFLLFLPTRDRLDEVAYQKGEQVSLFRRLCAFFIDWFFLSIISILLSIYYHFPSFLNLFSFYDWNSFLYFVFLIFLYFIMMPWILKGRTIGKGIVRIQIVSNNSKKVSFLQYLLRYGTLYLLLYGSPFFLWKLIPYFDDFFFLFFLIRLFIGVLLLQIVFFIHIWKKQIFHKEPLFYETFSKTHHKSTIQRKRGMKEEDPCYNEIGE